jgi:rhamnosyl/mannosyltransferase
VDRGDGPLRVLFVGRLDAQKNVVRLVQAMARVTRPVELTVVGDGEEQPRVRAAVAAAGLTSVRLVGAVHGADLLGWYRWAEAFVLPSDREGMPLVVLEAMAAGLPVLVTDVPGSRELVEDVGIVVPPTPAGLAAGLDRLASDPVLRATLAERSRRRGAEHGWGARVEELETVYARSGVT